MKKGMFYIILAQGIYLLINILNNFLLPKYLSVDSYAIMKTYALYLSYAGFLHFGFNDGIYLKYGGIDLKDIDDGEFGSEIKSFLLLELPLTSALLIIGILLKVPMLLCFSIGMLGYNSICFLKYFYQAIGNFSKYSILVVLENILVFVLNVILIFTIHSDSAWNYISVKIIVSIGISLILFWSLNKINSFIKKGSASLEIIINNIKSGGVLMMSNFSSGIFTGMDRFFVKYLMTSFDFAMYSFAVSMESIINACISPITISMYNYFCKDYNRTPEKVKKIKALVLVWGFIVIAVGFPAKWIISVYLPQYENAINLIFILFATQLAYVSIKGIYVNVYKARGEQSLYFVQMIKMTILAFVLNTLFYFILHSMYSMAYATLVTAFVWLIVCEIKDKEYCFNIKEIVAINIILMGYLLIGMNFNAVVGLGIYIILVGIVLLILMKKTVLDFWQLIGQTYFEIINKRRKQL